MSLAELDRGLQRLGISRGRGSFQGHSFIPVGNLQGHRFISRAILLKSCSISARKSMCDRLCGYNVCFLRVTLLLGLAVSLAELDRGLQRLGITFDAKALRTDLGFHEWSPVRSPVPRKVGIRLPGNGNSKSHGARPAY